MKREGASAPVSRGTWQCSQTATGFSNQLAVLKCFSHLTSPGRRKRAETPGWVSAGLDPVVLSTQRAGMSSAGDGLGLTADCLYPPEQRRE